MVGLCGCEGGRYARSAADAAMFGPQTVRIHPTFTRAKDWTGDGTPDGVEAVLELQDEFGEPTRATGRAMFEVYQYRPYHPDPRGKRHPQVWEWSLKSKPEQVAHWSRALRAYSFKIPLDPGRQTVVLAASFELAGGTPRMFDQIILEPSGRTAPVPQPNTKPARPRRAPATGPATAPSDLDEPLDGAMDKRRDTLPVVPPRTGDGASSPPGAGAVPDNGPGARE